MEPCSLCEAYTELRELEDHGGICSDCDQRLRMEDDYDRDERDDC